MPLLGVFQVFDGISAITAGILRARGKQVSYLPLDVRVVFSSNFHTTVFGRVVESYVSLLRTRVGNRLIRSLRMQRILYIRYVSFLLCPSILTPAYSTHRNPPRIIPRLHTQLRTARPVAWAHLFLGVLCTPWDVACVAHGLAS